jgi:hypothetical protein
MALVGRGHALALENVTKMTTTSGTQDLNASHAEGTICDCRDSALVAFVECRPSAAGLELRLCRIEWCVTSSTGEMPLSCYTRVFQRKQENGKRPLYVSWCKIQET